MENNEILNLKTTLKMNFCNHHLTHPHYPMATKKRDMSYFLKNFHKVFFSKKYTPPPPKWSKSFSHHSKGQPKKFSCQKLFTHTMTTEFFVVVARLLQEFSIATWLVIKILFWSPFVMGATWMSTNNFLHSSWYMQRTCQNRHWCDAWCKVATSHQFWQP
jgi:hypothetical protein